MYKVVLLGNEVDYLMPVVTVKLNIIQHLVLNLALCAGGQFSMLDLLK